MGQPPGGNPYVLASLVGHTDVQPVRLLNSQRACYDDVARSSTQMTVCFLFRSPVGTAKNDINITLFTVNLFRTHTRSFTVFGWCKLLSSVKQQLLVN